MKNNTRKMSLAPLDNLFGEGKPAANTPNDDRQRVIEVPLSDLHTFKNHPFKVVDDNAMQELVDSIQQNGVLMPAIVRPLGVGGFELVAGHRRKHACELAGLDQMPVIVRELDDDEATLAMVGSNNQREKALPSEKAFAYKMMMDALKRQGTRNDVTCAQIEHKSEREKSREKVAQMCGVNRNQIQRYIRLTELIPSFLDMVDGNKLPFTAAVELSYLPQERQTEVLDVMTDHKAKPSLVQAKHIRELHEADRFTRQNVVDLLLIRKPDKDERSIRLPSDLLARCFPSSTQEQIVAAVRELLEEIASKRHR